MTAPAAEAAALEVRLGDHLALEEVSFRIEEGEFVAVVGPNGAGKSTLLRTLLGLIQPSSGEVRLFDRRPQAVPPSWIGYVPQLKTMDRSFPARAIELVVAGLRQSWPAKIGTSERATALAALGTVGAAHLAGRAIGHLSGGEMQRVYLARSLVRRPRLLILDEPATGMDAKGEADMYRLLEGHRAERGTTVIMVTQDWGVAFHHSSRVLVIDRRVVGFGRPDEPAAEESLRRAFGHVGHAHTMTIEGHRHD